MFHERMVRRKRPARKGQHVKSGQSSFLKIWLFILFHMALPDNRVPMGTLNAVVLSFSLELSRFSGALEHYYFLFFHIKTNYWEFHHPNWLIHIFQRAWLKPPTTSCCRGLEASAAKGSNRRDARNITVLWRWELILETWHLNGHYSDIKVTINSDY